MLNYRRLLLFLCILLLTAVVAAFVCFNGFKMKHLLIAIGCILALVIVVSLIREQVTRRRKTGFFSRAKRHRAKLVEMRLFPDEASPKEAIINLQINFDKQDKSYRDVVVLHRPNSVQLDFLREEKEFIVLVDPKNKYKLIIPDLEQRANARSSVLNIIKNVWWGVLPFSGAIAPVVILIINFLEPEGPGNFITLASVAENQGNVWELRIKKDVEWPYKGTYTLEIYDPGSDEDPEAIERELNSVPRNFFIVENGQKVWVIGMQEELTPVIDVYDAATHKRMADIESFIATNKILEEGIANLYFEYIDDPYQSKRTNTLEIITNRGDKVFFDIKSETFSKADKDWSDFQWTVDSARICGQGYSFMLGYKEEWKAYRSLYKTVATGEGGCREMWALSDRIHDLDTTTALLDSNLNIEYSIIAPGSSFLWGSIIYSDSSLVVIFHERKQRKGLECMISVIDKTGHTLFAIDQALFPNSKSVGEYLDNYGLGDDLYPEVVRDRNHLMFTFQFPKAAGAICHDIKTGAQLWKYEVEEDTDSDE